VTPATIMIPQAKWDSLGHDVHRGCYLLEQLREANVPVQGAIWPTSVDNGVLMQLAPAGGLLIWSWTP
jgi:hypothetical protein